MGSVQVQAITVSSFMQYAKPSTVTFPPVGLVVITGENGTGKSSVMEAVATGLWGRTLRGTQPWRTDEAGQVDVTCEGYAATRKCSAKGRKTLTFTGDAQYETTTKAQAALEHMVGDWDLWRRTSVFSAYDAAHFSEASDGERKKLLEVLVGNARFDPALSACREELRATVGRFDRLKHARDTLAGTVQTQRENLKQARRLMNTLSAQAIPDATKYKQLGQALEGTDAQLSVLRKKLSESTRHEGAHESYIRRLEQQLDVLKEGTCNSCGQEIAEQFVAEVHARLNKTKAETKKLMTESESLRVSLETEVRALNSKVERLREQRGEERRSLEEAKSNMEARNQAEESVKRATEALSGLEDQLEDTTLAIDLVEQEAGTLRACEQVLGLKGVRAHILGSALEGLTELANYWLGIVAGGGLTLEFRAYAEKSNGGVSDALSMEVTGAGGGHGYRASSGGQRRRMDVAVLLSLAELAGGVHNTQQNTLFFDEVFDSLDSAGIEAVVHALQEVAQSRTVVVISHNPRLVSALDAVKYYRTTGESIVESAKS